MSLFIVVCFSIMIPLASIQGLVIFQNLTGHAIITAAGRFLDFVVCVSIMMLLASIEVLLIFGSFIGHAIIVAASKCLC